MTRQNSNNSFSSSINDQIVRNWSKANQIYQDLGITKTFVSYNNGTTMLAQNEKQY